MKLWQTDFSKIELATLLMRYSLLVSLVNCLVHNVNGQTQHLLMRKPICNSGYRYVPAAVLEGAPGLHMARDVCDVTLSAPGGQAVWMLRMERADILDCDVVLQVFDGETDPPAGKPLMSQGCVSSDPGIVHIHSATIIIRLRHNNSSNYSFSMVATARKSVTKSDASCGGFRCKNNNCIAKSLLCDAVDNCFDSSDEPTNGTSLCEANYWPFPGENWGVLASVLGVGLVLGITAACCRHLRSKQQSAVDDLYELNEGPYVHKYAYRYAVIRPPKQANNTNVVLGRDGYVGEIINIVGHSGLALDENLVKSWIWLVGDCGGIRVEK